MFGLELMDFATYKILTALELLFHLSQSAFHHTLCVLLHFNFQQQIQFLLLDSLNLGGQLRRIMYLELVIGYFLLDFFKSLLAYSILH